MDGPGANSGRDAGRPATIHRCASGFGWTCATDAVLVFGSSGRRQGHRRKHRGARRAARRPRSCTTPLRPRRTPTPMHGTARRGSLRAARTAAAPCISRLPCQTSLTRRSDVFWTPGPVFKQRMSQHAGATSAAAARQRVHASEAKTVVVVRRAVRVWRRPRPRARAARGEGADGRAKGGPTGSAGRRRRG